MGAGCCGLVASQYYDESIYSDNGLYWRGMQGNTAICPDWGYNASLAYAMDFKFDDLNDLDNMGGTAVKLYCRDTNGITGYVSSLEGSRGEWQGIRSCPTNEAFIGFRLRVFPDQGTWGDDFGVDNIQMACSGGTIVDGIDGVPPTTFEAEEREEKVEQNVIRQWMEKVGRKIETIRLRLDNTRLHGDWGTWAYCSPDLYVVGIRTTVEEGSAGDDAGLTDVTLYCA